MQHKDKEITRLTLENKDLIQKFGDQTINKKADLKETYNQFCYCF